MTYVGELVGSLELNRVAYLFVSARCSVAGSWNSDAVIQICSIVNGFDTGDKDTYFIKITHYYLCVCACIGCSNL